MVTSHEGNPLQDDDESAPGTLSKFLTGTYLVQYFSTLLPDSLRLLKCQHWLFCKRVARTYFSPNF